eukprot:3941856-Rhodomonas_salina.3
MLPVAAYTISVPGIAQHTRSTLGAHSPLIPLPVTAHTPYLSTAQRTPHTARPNSTIRYRSTAHRWARA